jgi:hypothetical protein
MAQNKHNNEMERQMTKEINSQFIFKNSYGLLHNPEEKQSTTTEKSNFADVGQGVRFDGDLDMSRINNHQYFMANKEAIIARLSESNQDNN